MKQQKNNKSKNKSNKKLNEQNQELADNFFGNVFSDDPDELIKILKKEEEETKILLNDLKTKKQISRDFMKDFERERTIKERYNTKKKLMQDKEQANYDMQLKVLKNEDNINRFKKMNTIINKKIKEYVGINSKNKEEKILILNEKRDLTKVYSNKETIRLENIQKIKNKKEEEEKRKKLLKKMQKDNERFQELIKNGFKPPDKNKNIIFNEENIISGTNLSPDNVINNKIKKRPKSVNQKSGISQLPKVCENLDFKAIKELTNILKNEPDNLKKLILFKKKYKYFDISSYIHTAKMNDIKNAKVVRIKHEDIYLLNLNPDLNFNFEIGKNNPDDIIVYRSYLQACKYNNNEHIQAYLLKAKNDIEVFTIVNEKDEFGRNGLMYLLIHNNINMIKLTLLSGVILDNSTDIFGRNLIHYCCTNYVDKNILDIICHCIDFKNFSDLCKYVDKCIPIDNENLLQDDIYSTEYQLKCEQKIKNFDDLFEDNKKIIQEYEDKKNNEIKEMKDPYENVYKKQIYIGNIVNSPDKNGDYPLHYLIKSEDIDKMEILIYFHARVDVTDSNFKKPINLTNNEKIQQFLLKQEENLLSKNNNLNNNNNNLNKSNTNFNNSGISSMLNITTSALDMEKIQYYTSEKINKFKVGVEKNTYLILSVIQQNYDTFKFLLEEKKAKVDYINENGWTVLNFIILKKLWNFLFFLLKINICSTTKEIYSELSKNKIYDKKIIYENEKKELTFTGQALKVIDISTKNKNNLLSLCIDELNDIYLFKSLVILFNNHINFFVINQQKDLLNNKEKYQNEQNKLALKYMTDLFNKNYGKNKESLLIKCIKKNNLDLFNYILNDISYNNQKINIDIYKTDSHNQNILHHAVLLKQKNNILFLVKYDIDNKTLMSTKDNKNNTPFDYDRTKSFKYEMLTIWDAAEKNDINLIEKLVNELHYYNFNEQTRIEKNTALHIAVENKSDKVILFLLKNNAEKNIKNKKGLTPLDIIDTNKNKNFQIDKRYTKIVKALFDGKIKEYVDLDSCNFKSLKNNENFQKQSDKINFVNGNIENIFDKSKENPGKISKISYGICNNKNLRDLLIKIKECIENKKIDIEKLFKELDTNKNGVLEMNEFENLFRKLNIDGVSKDDRKLLISYLDSNKDNMIDYEEFINIVKV